MPLPPVEWHFYVKESLNVYSPVFDAFGSYLLMRQLHFVASLVPEIQPELRPSEIERERRWKTEVIWQDRKKWRLVNLNHCLQPNDNSGRGML
jgi:hypothetical protein